MGGGTRKSDALSAQTEQTRPELYPSPSWSVRDTRKLVPKIGAKNRCRALENRTDVRQPDTAATGGE